MVRINSLDNLHNTCYAEVSEERFLITLRSCCFDSYMVDNMNRLIDAPVTVFARGSRLKTSFVFFAGLAGSRFQSYTGILVTQNNDKNRETCSSTTAMSSF
jgi:hypothetical protein